MIEPVFSEKLLKPYDPRATEERIYKRWEDSGFFNPDNLPRQRRGEPPRHQTPYTIMIAPPNVTGSLHMGHALENILSDVLIRFKRMQGYKALWLPGTDHAGIATQNAVEKELKKQKISRHDLGREEFVKRIWQWRGKYGDIILEQLKKLGCSLDWSRTRFTMDESYAKAVETAFQHYWDKGLIYRGERVVNWCVKDQTALSDLELEYTDEKTSLWYLKYPIKNSDDFIQVATTRPETMLGDEAVAVNPKDKRYKNLVGQTALLPIMEREIPIIADPSVDKEFGTGAVKVTPAHSLADNEIAERHKLPLTKVVNELGRITNTKPEFDGLKVSEAREKVLETLTAKNLIGKTEKINHRLARCYRCDSVIEPLPSKQWFLKMKPLARQALEAIQGGKVKYYPARWQKIAEEWLHGVRDWCISRQIWWGHKISVETTPQRGGQDGDVFDTWFSSALWPFATLGWPEKDAADLKTYYPTQLVTSAREILHLWIARMIFSGLEFTEQVPFSSVIIHPTVLNKEGKRMSKSLGTGIDPLLLIEKYGADALRFGLLYQTFQNQDIRFSEDSVKMGKKFANKIWNIARFVRTSTDGKIPDELPKNFAPSEPEGKKMIGAGEDVARQVSVFLENYQFGEAAHLLYDFVWHQFADQYIEHAKKDLTEEQKIILTHTLTLIIKLLHPLMPHLTEELWSIIRQDEKELLLVAPWPQTP